MKEYVLYQDLISQALKFNINQETLLHNLILAFSNKINLDIN